MEFVREALTYPWQSIVDFGCGYGAHVAAFATAGRQATGVDITVDPAALRDAAAGHYDLVPGSWPALVGSQFDAGWSHHCLEYLRDPIGALHAWGLLIRPGGWLFLVVPAYHPITAAGHISMGWDTNKLALNLAVAGWDCRAGRFRQGPRPNAYGENVYAIVQRPPVMTIADTHVAGWGEVRLRLPESWDIRGNHVGPAREVNW